MSNPDEMAQSNQPLEPILGEAQRLLDEIRNMRAQTEEQLKAAEAARKKADDDATYAYQAKVNAETHAKEVSTFKGQSESEFNAITSNKQKTDEQLAAMNAAKPQIESDASAITARRKQADQDKDALGKIIEQLTNCHGTATKHETRVDEIRKELEALIKRVENLLPGATSASLASAFGSQKRRFGTPRLWWVITFIVCVVLLALLGLPGFVHAFSAKPSDLKWEEILRGIAARLPILIPLVWLAIYAGRNYMLSLRLEEDYAYKEAISTAFEGYKREMKEIPAGDAANPSPLTTLCGNILRAISERPGRIYEGKQDDITLLTELKAAAEKAEELRQKTIATK